MGRERWILKNISNQTISIGDLPGLPDFSSGMRHIYCLVYMIFVI
jgi:hypothetical protein